MFNQQELQILLGGVDTPIDLEDLRQHTNYGGLYDDHAPTIQLFWKVADSFDQEQRRKLLRFATSCSRPPLLCVAFVSIGLLPACSRGCGVSVGASRNSCLISLYETPGWTRIGSRPQVRASTY